MESKKKIPLYIITGAYGKTGKTSGAISIALYHLKQGREVRIVDCNPQNPDIDRVFDFFHRSGRTEAKSSRLSHYVVDKKDTDFGSDKHIEIATPLLPPESFHDTIHFIAEVAKDFDDDEVIIADTNHHIAISSSLEELLDTDKNKSMYKNLLNKYKITFVHYWDFSSISYKKELKRTKKAVVILERLGIQVLNVFSAHMMQMLSVLSLRQTKTSKKNLDDMEKTFRKFAMIEKKNKIFSIPFGSFYHLLDIAHEKATILKVQKDRRIIAEQYPKIWLEVFTGLKKYIEVKTKDKSLYPNNIVLIPYFREMIGFVGRVSVVGIRNTKELEEMMSKYYKIIASSLS